MTHVIHLPRRNAGAPVQSAPSQSLTPDRQATIENCLQMSLQFVRRADATAADLWAATSRCNRALTLLKQACECVPAVGSAS